MSTNTSSGYFEHSVYLSDNQQQKLTSCLKKKSQCSVRIDPSKKGNSKLFLTQTQINKLEKAKKEKKCADLTFSVTQINHQQGGFLPIVGSLLAAAAPTLAKSALGVVASTAGKKHIDKLTGKGTRIPGKQYGKGTRILGKNYN